MMNETTEPIPRNDEQVEIDPVCGKELARDEATASTSYEGETYFFCSAQCERAFLHEPERYRVSCVEVK